MALGCPASYITEIELGTKYPNARRLEAIADFLGVRRDDLYERPDAPSKLGQVIAVFPSLPDHRQQIVVDLIDSLAAVPEQEQ